MKLVFDLEGSKDRKFTKVIAVPTTAKEKRFFSTCKDANGNYKLWVYSTLYALDEQIIDNPMIDVYDNHGNLVHNSKVIMDRVRKIKVTGDYANIPKPSNFCILSLYYTLNERYNKVRRLDSLYMKRIFLWLNQSIVVSREKGDNNDDTK